MDEQKDKISIDIELPDLSPTDSEVRKQYVADIKTFYDNIFKSVIEKARFDVFAQLAETTNSTNLDYILKAQIEAYKNIEEWFLKMSTEQINNLSGEE